MNCAPSQLSRQLVAVLEEALRLGQAAREHDEERDRQVGDGLGVLARAC